MHGYVETCMFLVQNFQQGMQSMPQGVVIPIGAVVIAVTEVKKWSRGQGLFLVLVKQSRTIIKLGNSCQEVYVCMCVLHLV